MFIYLLIYIVLLIYLLFIIVYLLMYIQCLFVNGYAYIYIYSVCSLVRIHIYIYRYDKFRGSLGKLVWIRSLCQLCGFTEARNIGNCRWVYPPFASPLCRLKGRQFMARHTALCSTVPMGAEKYSHGTKQSQKLKIGMSTRKIVYLSQFLWFHVGLQWSLNG